jgi:hypothetical protein
VRKLVTAAAVVGALALAGGVAAAVVPGTFAQNPADAGCVKASVASGTLHLEKNCATATVASAFGTITGVGGQPFVSTSFTLASTSQCHGGSPRFNIVSSNGTTYFLGCNNVAPVVNANGTATYTFTAATIAAGGNQVPVPAGTINAASVLIDVQGTADVGRVFVNGQYQAPVPSPGTGGGNGNGGRDKHRCPDGHERRHDCGKHKGDQHGDHRGSGNHQGDNNGNNHDNNGNNGNNGDD